MEYDGETIIIQHACINRALLPCVLLETYFRPNLLERTNGKVEFITSSFPELGLAGPDTLSLVTSGTLDSATIYGGYVGGEMPPIEIQNLWGIYSSREQEFEATQAIIKDIEEMVLAETEGVIMNHNWYAGNDQFFFCREKIDSLDGFAGKKTRSHSAALSDWINGMGADPQFLAFAEVYTAIERGILDCGVTGADAGFGQRWYEVTDYIIGPLLSFPSNNNVINGNKWGQIPQDLQMIITEEAAKSELEALRIAAIQNEMGLLKNTSSDTRGAGIDAMEFVPFSEEMTFRSLNTAVMEHVVPAWVNRVGDTDHPIIADSFNQKVGPSSVCGLTTTAQWSRSTKRAGSHQGERKRGGSYTRPFLVPTILVGLVLWPPRNGAPPGPGHANGGDGGGCQVHYHVGPDGRSECRVGERSRTRLGAAFDLPVCPELVTYHATDDAPGHTQQQCEDDGQPLLAVKPDPGDVCPDSGPYPAADHGHYHKGGLGAGP